MAVGRGVDAGFGVAAAWVKSAGHVDVGLETGLIKDMCGCTPVTCIFWIVPGVSGAEPECPDVGLGVLEA